MPESEQQTGSNRHRVLFVTFPGYEGGPQAWFAQLERRPEFARAVDVQVWTPGDFYRGMRRKPALLVRCRSEYRQAGRPPVVYVSLDLDLAAQVVLGMRLAGAPCIVVHAHATRFGSQRSLRTRIYRRLVRHLAQRKVAVSPKAARAMFGQDIGPVELLPAFIDFEALWNDSEREPDTGVATEWKASKPGFVFACVGRLAESKNLSLAIDAFARFHAASDGADSCLLLIGSGPLESELRERARRAGLADRIHFTGWVDNPAWFYRHAVDCMLMPSLHEGAPRTVLEAQAFGCSVIVSKAVPEFCLYREDLAARPAALEPQVWADEMGRAAARGSKRVGHSTEIARQHPLFSIDQGMGRLLELLRPRQNKSVLAATTAR